MDASTNDRWLDYAWATLAVVAALFVRLAVNPVIPGRAPWVFYFPAIAIVAWRSGLWPSAWTLLLSAVTGWFFWVPPAGSFALKDPKDLYLLLMFVASGSVIVAFGAANERTHRSLRETSVAQERIAYELAESLESFQGIFEHAQGDAVILMDASFVILAWSPGAEVIFGNAADEVVGRHVDFIFPSEDRDRDLTALNRQTATQRGVAAERGWYRRKDGQRFWGDGSLVALHHADGTIRGYVKILRDETARFELEETNRRQAEALERHIAEATADLRAANAELEGFTYSVSHDMRAPLRAIVGHARILMEDYAENLPEDARERIERMAKASTRMSLLIEDLLTYARLNKQPVTKKSIDLAQIFREVVADESVDIPIEAYAPAELPVHAEPGLMRMVIENLVGNAVKYRRPEVLLRLKFMLVNRDGMCGYALRDNGIGFEMQYAPKLFEPFERLHGNETIEGTGIGLANVRRIVQRHGGDVWAEGEPGVGATFGFTLP